jgi:N-acyl-D-aspartate/D-glutamate deacylase
MTWDLVIRDALVFDGSGRPPERVDVAVAGGRIVAKGLDLDSAGAGRVVDGRGRWLLPGMLDIHTHYDLEVEVAPGLSEWVRHGTTSVVMGNCSLGVAFGLQLGDDARGVVDSPIVDCFARVENIPKTVLVGALEDSVDWKDPLGYLEHLGDRPLGPNVTPLLPHSMLRVEVMGMPGALRDDPSPSELRAMADILDDALAHGYVGFSTDGLPLHYLANDPHRQERLPAHHAPRRERRTLADVVRRHGGVVQYTPDSDDTLAAFDFMLMSSGRLYGAPLKMTVTAILDMATNRASARGLLGFSRLLNSPLLGGHLRMQALAAPFKVTADGTTSPLMEERPSFAELNSVDIGDREGRRRLLDDPDYVERFRREWMVGKTGVGPARLARFLEFETSTFSRSLDDIVVESCPVEEWKGEQLSSLYERVRQWQAAGRGARTLSEESAFARFPRPLDDEADFLLHLLREYDRSFRWSAVTANRRPAVLRKLLFDDNSIPGFSDSGAHLTNMAFFDINLRTLRIAAAESMALVAKAVRRLTREPADLFGVDAGTLDIGARADLGLIDPDALRRWDPDNSTTMIHRSELDHPQMVNRSDGVVILVAIGGHVAFEDGEFSPELGRRPMGRLLLRKSA